MIEFFKQQIASAVSKEDKLNRLRELLQLLCLKIIYDRGYFSKVAFVGGTALRFLYGLRRFSEDLDFSVINKKDYDFRKMVFFLKYEFNMRGLELEARPKVVKTVQASMLKFPKLLKTMELSNLEEQKLSIKIEIDSNPPSGWNIENTLITKVYMINVTHFALPSLFATKLHACFFRKYTKGRDFYDLVWYLGRKIKPNYTLLNNAIKQTEREALGLSKDNIKDFLLKRLDKVDFVFIRKDVERFLEDKTELKLLDRPVISKLIENVFP